MHNKETEIIDKLFLELSQFTTATTKRERELAAGLMKAIQRLETIQETHPDIDLEEDLKICRSYLGGYHD